MENPTINLVHSLRLIKYPLITEKTYKLQDKGKYTFIVDRSLNKQQLKYLLENIFAIKIVKINTLVLPIRKKRIGKFIGKKPNYKKVIITLKKGDVIKDIFAKNSK